MGRHRTHYGIYHVLIFSSFFLIELSLETLNTPHTMQPEEPTLVPDHFYVKIFETKYVSIWQSRKRKHNMKIQQYCTGIVVVLHQPSEVTSAKKIDSTLS